MTTIYYLNYIDGSKQGDDELLKRATSENSNEW